MIRYLKDHEKEITKELYREAFPEDSDAFVEYYYSYVTKNNQILVLEQAGRVCSMLHLNPYRISVGKETVDACYYVAVATGKGFRHQGMMRRLMCRSLQDIRKKGQPFAYLMPADRAIYEPFDFRIVYEQKKTELPPDPEEANKRMAELFDVYTVRDPWYVEKLLEEERVCAGEAPFDIVPYIMMRITHVEKMLELLKGSAPFRKILQIKDAIISENNGYFLWENSNGKSNCKRLTKQPEEPWISLEIGELTEFVFGKRKIRGLEEIPVFEKICINESV